MIIFARYLGTLIGMLQNNNIDHIKSTQALLRNELYLQHRQISLYKECIQSFFRTSKYSAGAIIAYQHGMFTLLSQHGSIVTSVDFLTQDTNPIGRACHYVINAIVSHHSMLYRHSYTVGGQTYMVTGSLQSDKHILLFITKAEKPEAFALLNTTHSQETILYTLYLQTSVYGKMLNKALPAFGRTILLLKHNLLSTMLKRNPIFIDAHPADVTLITYYLSRAHPIQQTTTVEAEELNAICANGVYPIPFLTLFNRPGICVIKNIEQINFTIQQRLGKFIAHGAGVFEDRTTYQYIEHSRLVLTSVKSLNELCQKQLIHPHLFNHIKDNVFHLPPPTALNKDELGQLITGLIEQLSHHQVTTNTTLALHELLNNHYSNFKELYLTIKKLMVPRVPYQKSTNHPLEQTFDDHPTIYFSRQHLKNQNTLINLWKYYGNYRTVAAILGVHPSSVYRRLKQIGPHKES